MDSNTLENKITVKKEPGACNICKESLDGKDKVTLHCHNTHKFCLQCINQWLKKSPNCPNCRTTIGVFENKKTNNTNNLLAQLVNNPENKEMVVYFSLAASFIMIFGSMIFLTKTFSS